MKKHHAYYIINALAVGLVSYGATSGQELLGCLGAAISGACIVLVRIR